MMQFNGGNRVASDRSIARCVG